jgi:hypothetical protein
LGAGGMERYTPVTLYEYEIRRPRDRGARTVFLVRMEKGKHPFEQFESQLEMGRNWAARFEEPRRAQEAIQWAFKQIRVNQWQKRAAVESKNR